MTPELRAKIEAEEKYPLYTREEIESVDISMVSMYLASNVEARSKHQVYIACATEYAAKVEELTTEVSDLKEKLRITEIELANAYSDLTKSTQL